VNTWCCIFGSIHVAFACITKLHFCYSFFSLGKACVCAIPFVSGCVQFMMTILCDYYQFEKGSKFHSNFHAGTVNTGRKQKTGQGNKLRKEKEKGKEERETHFPKTPGRGASVEAGKFSVSIQLTATPGGPLSPSIDR
jgi:hypothetical protein